MARIIAIIGFCLLMLFELGSVSALPSPWHLIALTPLALIAFVVAGWGREVWALALIAGIMFDSFSAFPSGTFIVIMVVFALLVRWLSRRWFTTRSWLSTVTLIMVSIAGFFLLVVLARGILMLFSESPIVIITMRDAVTTIILGTLVSTMVGMAAMGGYIMLRYFLGRKFFVPRPTRRV